MESLHENLQYHGDQASRKARVDFAVNVASPTPAWLIDALTPTLNAYPDRAVYARLREKLAALHGVAPESVALLNGASEGFSLLPALVPQATVTMVHPSFTEPEAILRAAPGTTLNQVIVPIDTPYEDSDTADRIFSGDMTIFGNPTNPTGILHDTRALHAVYEEKRKAGEFSGVVVVDEAFMDVADHDSCHNPVSDTHNDTAGDSVDGAAAAPCCGHVFKPAEETASWIPMAAQADSNTIVMRSLTKTFGIPGLRLGYAIGDPALIARMEGIRPAWPLGTMNLQALEAILTQCEDNPDIFCSYARTIASQREYLSSQLRAIGWVPKKSNSPYIITNISKADVVDYLQSRRISVRRCDTFPGLDKYHLRLAVRDKEAVDELILEIKTHVGLGTCSVAQW
ncbi:MAG: aminotransferase class I/II-fold pyridoxal phosphate-dependent enzyme [Corynebacterium sp.]|nr:aminotransferase class I/II-fold pyridoxal phosphate-dependent enzyme [Corynebacterium sp.]